MTWPTVSAVGFVLVTALVIVLARRSTARWEREKRSDRPRPATPVGISRLAAGRAAWSARARAGASHVALRGRAGDREARVRPVPDGVAPTGAAAGTRGARRVRRVRRVRRRIADRLAHRHDDGHRRQTPSGSAD